MELFAIQVIPYLATIIGFLIVWILNGIKSEIREVKTSVRTLETDLRNSHNDLSSRVTRLEADHDHYHRTQEDRNV